ncbi:hypothetical protein LK09_17140 [Microbacterium mangrovi]|uniref:Lactococcin 972 family bacteriocin n=1 Tax=Microbacterium mangrovi TaxID=1348253 RepID=A0A0B2A2L1_9MICO|nr:hypothetical protein [Microbacterium mangrovi]KHK96064.1 hypothetical protein LK09_17140 [Microbacterium mangrovi]
MKKSSIRVGAAAVVTAVLMAAGSSAASALILDQGSTSCPSIKHVYVYSDANGTVSHYAGDILIGQYNNKSTYRYHSSNSWRQSTRWGVAGTGSKYYDGALCSW